MFMASHLLWLCDLVTQVRITHIPLLLRVNRFTAWWGTLGWNKNSLWKLQWMWLSKATFSVKKRHKAGKQQLSLFWKWADTNLHVFSYYWLKSVPQSGVISPKTESVLPDFIKDRCNYCHVTGLWNFGDWFSALLSWCLVLLVLWLVAYQGVSHWLSQSWVVQPVFEFERRFSCSFERPFRVQSDLHVLLYVLSAWSCHRAFCILSCLVNTSVARCVRVTPPCL